MKYFIQLLLCSGLLLSSVHPQWRSQSIATSFNVKNHSFSLGPSSSGPETPLESVHAASKFVTVDGTRLHFLVEGGGRPVVLIHGNPGSAQDWTRLFDPLAARHKIVAYDRPGHGQSQRPKHGEATVVVQARLLHEALNELHIDRPIIVGHSWGAALALVYAINYPKEVAGLVLVAPAVYSSPEGVLTSIPAVPVIGDAANLVLTPLFGPSLVRSELKKAFSPDPVPPSYLRAALSEWTKPKKAKAFSLDEELLNSCVKEFGPRYSEVTVPVSILTGDSDLCVSEKDNAARLHEALPKSRLVVLPKTGHEIPFTHSQSVIAEIERVQALSRVRTL